MGYVNGTDLEYYLLEVARGNVPGAYIINKFGRNIDVGTSILEPICLGGEYRTPTALTSLEILSDDANDALAGTGARTVRIWGSDFTATEITADVNLNGLTAVAIGTQFFRVTRMQVIASGTYASTSAMSQAGTIILRGAGGGSEWARIDEAVPGMGVGQSQIGVTFIPTGHTGYLLDKRISIATTKEANIYFFTREQMLTVTPPYSAMCLKEQHNGLSSFIEIDGKAPLLTIPEETDCGMMGLGITTPADISVEFQILVEAN